MRLENGHLIVSRHKHDMLPKTQQGAIRRLNGYEHTPRMSVHGSKSDPFTGVPGLGKKGYHNLCGPVGSNIDRIEQWPEGCHAANAVVQVEEEPVAEEQVTEEDMLNQRARTVIRGCFMRVFQ
jgi:hypothetical protein